MIFDKNPMKPLTDVNEDDLILPAFFRHIRIYLLGVYPHYIYDFIL